MKPETDGHTPPRGDPADPLEAAEARRDARAGAAAKASRLVTILRRSSKQKKALQTVLSGLKQLNLGAEEPR